MIRLRIERLEDDGSTTDLGDVHMVELGVVASYRETPEGTSIMRDVRAALACLAPRNVGAVRRELFTAAKDRVFSVHADLLRRLS